MKSLTTTPRSTVRPASLASLAFGRMPAEITTISQSSVAPSLNCNPVTWPFAENRCRVFVEMDLHAHRFHRAFERRARRGVELNFHQMRHQVNDVDFRAQIEQAARRFQSEQPAADHGRALAAPARNS